MARRRPFFARVVDVLIGLASYVVSRWIWQRGSGGVFDHLLEELGTFAGIFVVLQLVRRALARPRAEE